jgi:hypothetical protein
MDDGVLSKWVVFRQLISKARSATFSARRHSFRDFGCFFVDIAMGRY